MKNTNSVVSKGTIWKISETFIFQFVYLYIRHSESEKYNIKNLRTFQYTNKKLMEIVCFGARFLNGPLVESSPLTGRLFESSWMKIFGFCRCEAAGGPREGSRTIRSQSLSEKSLGGILIRNARIMWVNWPALTRSWKIEIGGL